MPKKGDIYIFQLNKAHLEWGSHRHTHTRNIIYGEGYILIPSEYAKTFEIYNSNKEGANVLYKCSSSDGFLRDVELRAAGSSERGGQYAKQFQGSGNLKVVGDWYKNIGAIVGDQISVEFTSSNTLLLKKI